MSKIVRKKKRKERTFERNIRRMTPFSIIFMILLVVGMGVLLWFSLYEDENGNVTLPKWFVVFIGDLPWAIGIFSAGMVLYVWRDRAKSVICHAWHSTYGLYWKLFETNEVVDKKTGATIEPSFTGIAVGGTGDEDMFVVTKPRRILVVPTAHINDYNAGGLAIDSHPDPTPFEELPDSVKAGITQSGGRVRFDPEVDKVEFSRDYCPPKNKGVVRSFQKYDLALRQASAENKSLRGKVSELELTVRGLMRQRRLEVEGKIGGSVGPNETDNLSRDINTRGQGPG